MTNPASDLPAAPELLAFAHALADASGAVIRPYFRASVNVDDKADLSPVTIADREAEAAIRVRIETRFPDHGILGEEHGSIRLDADHVWVIDPIDGTRSFIYGVPLFGTLIALWQGDTPVMGVIDQPISGERWIGLKNHGSSLNGQSLATRSSVPLDQAVLFTTAPELHKGPAAGQFSNLRARVGAARYGTDCYAAGLLAAGHIDIMIEHGIQPYDYAALVPVIEQAGGIVSDWAGNPLTLSSDGSFLASGSAALHDKALRALTT